LPSKEEKRESDRGKKKNRALEREEKRKGRTPIPGKMKGLDSSADASAFGKKERKKTISRRERKGKGLQTWRKRRERRSYLRRKKQRPPRTWRFLTSLRESGEKGKKKGDLDPLARGKEEKGRYQQRKGDVRKERERGGNRRRSGGEKKGREDQIGEFTRGSVSPSHGRGRNEKGKELCRRRRRGQSASGKGVKKRE